MSRFEFLIVDLDPRSDTTSEDVIRLDDLGQQGWEIVAIVPFGQFHRVYLQQPCGVRDTD